MASLAGRPSPPLPSSILSPSAHLSLRSLSLSLTVVSLSLSLSACSDGGESAIVLRHGCLPSVAVAISSLIPCSLSPSLFLGISLSNSRISLALSISRRSNARRCRCPQLPPPPLSPSLFMNAIARGGVRGRGYILVESWHSLSVLPSPSLFRPKAAVDLFTAAPLSTLRSPMPELELQSVAVLATELAAAVVAVLLLGSGCRA